MKRITDYVLRPGIFLACALLLGITVNAQTKDLNGYYQSDDGGAYYIRQIGDKVFWFGEDPDGNKGTLLRLWEQAGSPGAVTIMLPAEQQRTKATPVDLRGEVSGKPVKIINGKFSCTIKAFGPASFILE